jgi:hypothetical protein
MKLIVAVAATDIVSSLTVTTRSGSEAKPLSGGMPRGFLSFHGVRGSPALALGD